MRQTPILALSLAVFLTGCTDTKDPVTPDTTAPTLVISSGIPAGSTATGPVTFTFAFSEPIDASFTAASVTTSNCTVGTFTRVNTTTSTLTLTPATGSGTLTLEVAAGAFKDLAGNVSTSTYSTSLPYGLSGPDTTAPTLVVSSGIPAGSTATGPVTFTFAFSEPIDTTFTADQVTVTNGVKGTFTRVNETTSSLVVTPSAGTGTMTVDVAAGAFKDLAGNANTAAGSASVLYSGAVVDTTAPVVSISTGLDAAATATGPVVFMFSFSEAIDSTFTAASITVTNGTKGTFTRVNATTSTLVVTPSAGTGTVTVSVAAGAFKDLAGNPSTAAATTSIPYSYLIPDTTAPTVSVSTGLDAGATATGPVVFMFAFSEAVDSTFTAASVAVTNGTKGTFTRVNASTITLVVTPSAGTGTLSVNVAAGAFKDLAGNANTAAGSASVLYSYLLADTTAPTATIFSNLDSGATATGPVTFTFVFSEAIDNTFTASSVSVTNGTKGTFTRVSPTVSLLTVTPPIGSGTLTLTLAAGAFKDVAGNPSTASYQPSVSYAVTSIAPTVTITSDAGPGSIAAGDVTFTFTFSEAITAGFTKSSIKVTGGTAGTFTRVSSTVSTLTVAPQPCVGAMSLIVPVGAFTATASGTANTVRSWVNQPYALPLLASATKSPKRGVAYNIDTPEDLAALAPGLGWWYNWSTDRSTNISDAQATAAGMDFLPMIWGSDFDVTTMEAKIAAMPNVKYLLVMNEPNFSDQARTPPEVAAAHWPKFEALAEKYNLQIVGPAMGFSGDPNYGDPVLWLDAFYAAYRSTNGGREPQIDALAIHWYDYGFDSYVNKFLRYGKTLWVTEVANWHSEYWWVIDTQAKQITEGLDNIIPFCEKNSNISRYSWFIGRMFPDLHCTSLLAQTVTDPATNTAVTTDGAGHNLFKANGDVNTYADLGLTQPGTVPTNAFPLLDAHGVYVMNDSAYIGKPINGQLSAMGTAYVNYTFNKINAPTLPMGPAPLPTLPLDQMTVLLSRVNIGWPIWNWGTNTNSTVGFTGVDESLTSDTTKTFRIGFSDGGGTGGYVVIENFMWAIDMTTMSKLHLDYWTGDGTTMKVKVVDAGADNTLGNADDTNAELTVTVTKKGAWQGVDLDFGALAKRNHIRQIVLWAPSKSTWYLDNIYCKQ